MNLKYLDDGPHQTYFRQLYVSSYWKQTFDKYHAAGLEAALCG